MKKLHPMQAKLIELLKDTIDDPLTVRELQENLELSSPSVVHHHIQQLEKKGYLRRNPSNPRDYQVLSDSPEKSICYLNLYGLAKCGPAGTLLDGSPVDRIPIASKLLGCPSHEAFVVKAKGKSMLPKIADGDFVIAQRAQIAKTGEMVVCVAQGEAKIKIVNFSETKQAILTSLNPAFTPEPVLMSDLRIEGIVKSILSFQINI